VAHGGVDRFPYAAASRLFYLASRHWWQIDGACARQGVDPARLPPRRFLNLVYSIFIENLDEEKRSEFERVLFAPVPGSDPDRPPSSWLADEAASFRAFAAEVNS
jgi:hypothetical protein